MHDDHGLSLPFSIDPFRRECLLEGLDDIGFSLKHGEALEKFEQRHDKEFWYAPRPADTHVSTIEELYDQPRRCICQPKTRLTGAEILWATLEGEGVREVFGYPGGAILPAYDALRKFPIRHILVRHEQSAVHMADGYARASGRVGVAIATSGPGATNMVTGIATAMLDSIPLVCITGQVGEQSTGHGRLSGSGHHRHYAAGDQAQLCRHPRRRPGAGAARRFPRGFFRPPRAGAGRHHQGCAAGYGRVRFRGCGPGEDRLSPHARCFPASIAEAVELIRRRASGR